MASLMENLIDTLNKESSEYELLLELSKKKTPFIIKSDLENIQKITDEEQEVVSRITRLDKMRAEVTADIANVLNKDVTQLKITNLVQMMAARPQEQKQLSDACDKLQKAVHALQRVNEQNGELINHSLELIEFDMNLLQAYKTAPQTANYDRGAGNAGGTMGVDRHGFDAKQ